MKRSHSCLRTAARLATVCLLAGCALAGARSASSALQPPAHQPAPVQPPETRGLVWLFHGSQQDVRDNWLNRGTDQPATWKVVNGAMITSGSDIVTQRTFGDYLLHLEWQEPYLPNAHGQARGNSGVGLHDIYEIQVLDSYGIQDPGTGDCGAVYGQQAPLINACRPPLVWQTYDILFRAARWDKNGHKTEDARVSVWQNGIPIQNNVDIAGDTGIGDGEPEKPGPGSIVLQFHGERIQYRNIWLIPLPDHGALHY